MIRNIVLLAICTIFNLNSVFAQKYQVLVHQKGNECNDTLVTKQLQNDELPIACLPLNDKYYLTGITETKNDLTFSLSIISPGKRVTLYTRDKAYGYTGTVTPHKFIFGDINNNNKKDLILLIDHGGQASTNCESEREMIWLLDDTLVTGPVVVGNDKNFVKDDGLKAGFSERSSIVFTEKKEQDQCIIIKRKVTYGETATSNLYMAKIKMNGKQMENGDEIPLKGVENFIVKNLTDSTDLQFFGYSLY